PHTVRRGRPLRPESTAALWSVCAIQTVSLFRRRDPLHRAVGWRGAFPWHHRLDRARAPANLTSPHRAPNRPSTVGHHSDVTPGSWHFTGLAGVTRALHVRAAFRPSGGLAEVVPTPAETQRTDCRRPRWCTRAPVRSGAIPVVRTRPVTTSWVAAWRTQSVSHSSQPEALLSTAAPESSPRACGTRPSWSSVGRPGVASQSASARPLSARMLTAHRRPGPTASARRASACTQNSTVGGSIETETSEVAVIARSWLPWRTAITLTPEASRAITRR